MTTLSGKSNIQKSIQGVSAISQDAESCSESELPLVLLRLKPLLESESLDSKSVRKLKEHIWYKDLIHIIIEVLRQDFSHVIGQWSTAVKLAQILVTVCAGFNPRVTKNETQQQHSEHVNEYYEILLPTAADSLLILVNNILEQEVDSGVDSSSFPSENITHFQTVIDSLLWFCSSHKSCVQRVLQSPYFLQILITDHLRHCHIVLSALETLVKEEPSSLSIIPPDVLNSIMDELVYKLSEKDETSALLSLKLTATLVNLNPSLLDLLTSRYTGLHSFVSKWKSCVQDPLVVHLCSELDARSVVEREEDRLNHAAVIVQATWRGYTSRKRIRNMHRGIRKFQRLYRSKKAQRNKQKTIELDSKTTKEARMLKSRRDRLTFHENQLSIIKQLPASDVQEFVKQQETQASKVIQCWWRGVSARNEYNELRRKAHFSKSAVVIQRAVRHFLQRNKLRGRDSFITPRSDISDREREQLQQEIAQYRETHSSSYKTQTKATELHNQVQDLLEQFCLSRTQAQRKKDEQRKLLLTQVSRDCDLLLSAPILKDLQSGDSATNVTTTFSSGSVHIAKMAQIAHKEELKAMDTPWWKRPALELNL